MITFTVSSALLWAMFRYGFVFLFGITIGIMIEMYWEERR